MPFNYIDYLIIVLGAILCFKRVAEIERYHMLRVVVLTSILTFFVVVFFIAYGITVNNPFSPCGNDGDFCITGM